MIFYFGRKAEAMARSKEEEGGLKLYTALAGFGGSSTRSELAAGILALMASGPAHIGSDSQAFVRKANSIRNRISEGGLQRRAWVTFGERSRG